MDLTPFTRTPSPEMLAQRLATAARAHGLARPGADAAAALRTLRDSGALAWPLPRRMDGLGLGLEPDGAEGAFASLREAGRLSLALGRLYEGHINALRLIFRYGSPAQADQAASDAPNSLFAIWAAEDPANPVRRVDGRLTGVKTFASGAGQVTRALITVQERGERLALVNLPPEDTGRVLAAVPLHGMAAAGTARVDLTDLRAGAAELVGGPGDYMAQPELALGIWRNLAVTSGGLAALLEALRQVLAERPPSGPQRTRFGAVLAWEETARLWARRAGLRAEREGDEAAAAYVKLAREPVGWAAQAMIGLAQRCAGLSGMLMGSPIEAACRDIATYLRQPALDETFEEAVAHDLAAAPG